MKPIAFDKPLSFPKISQDRFKKVLAFALLISCYIYMAPRIFAVMGQDWNVTYVPAVKALLAGRNPYLYPLGFTPTFFNPIWALFPLIPLVLLPPKIGLFAMAALTLDIYILVGLKLRARPLAFAFFLLSPSVIFSLRQLNIDAFVLLGFLLPAPIGLFFVVLKPQIGIGMVIYWLIKAWQAGGVRRIIWTFAPVTIALAVTFILYGDWFAASRLLHAYWNWSIFPWGIPIGLALLAGSFLFKKKLWAAASGPFFSPYLGLYSWYIALIGFFDNEWLMTGAVLAMWIIAYFHG